MRLFKIEEKSMNNEDVLIICETCGAKNSANSAYCSTCGEKLGSNVVEIRQEYKDESSNEHYNSSQGSHGQNSRWNNGSRTAKSIFNYTFDINEFDDQLFNPSDKEISNFIESKQDYYFSEFNKMRDLNKNQSWNWAAFFFPVVWLAYRKMYLLAVIVAITISVINSVVPSLFMAGIIVHVLMGLFGNIKYMEHIQNSIVEAEKFSSESSRRSYLLEKGGVSMLGLIIALLLTTGIVAIPLFLIFSTFAGLGLFLW